MAYAVVWVVGIIAAVAAALFVLTVGLFGVFQMFLYGLDRLHTLNQRETALLALRNEVEARRALPFEALTDVEEEPFISVTPELDKLHLAQGLVTVETLEGDSPPSLKRLTVRVAWIGEYGRRIEKETVTLVTDTSNK